MACGPKSDKGRVTADKASRQSVKRLAAALEKAGRIEELKAAEHDPEQLDELMREFRIEGGGGGAF